MFAHVLVPLDGSKGAEEAVRYAKDVCRGKLLLFRVQNYPSLLELPLDPTAAPALLEAEEKASQTYLEDLSQQLVEQGTLVSWVTRMGDPATTILQEAVDARVDLIVIASHGRSGLGRFLLGSVAEKVVRHATCPVLVVRQAPA